MMHRRDLVTYILAERPDHLVAVSSLGTATWDLAAAGNHPKDFQFIGAMGQAAPFAMGVALAQPNKRVILFAGDGELLMGLGMLATIANQGPKNLAIVALDNERYLETGGQVTATGGRTDLSAVAAGCGFESAHTFASDDDKQKIRELALEAPGPVFVTAKVLVEELPNVFPASFDGASAINRFRDAIQD